MNSRCRLLPFFVALAAGFAAPFSVLGAGIPGGGPSAFPLPLDQYHDPAGAGVLEILRHRAGVEPFNLVVTAIFVLAIVHTLLASRFLRIAHRWRDEHRERLGRSRAASQELPGARAPVSFKAEMLHFLGEVEAIFGIWVIPLLIAFQIWKGWPAAQDYISHHVHFTEPLFVVVIMSISATRAVLRFAEQ